MEHEFFKSEKLDQKAVSNASDGQLNLVALTDSVNHQMETKKDSTFWLPLIQAEATGAAVGYVGGAGVGYYGAKVVGHTGELVLSAMARGSRVFSPTAIEEFAAAGAQRGGLYGAAIGISAVAVGYAAYEGYKWLTEDQKKSEKLFK